MANINYDLIVISIDVTNFSLDKINEMNEWCKKICKEEFYLRWYGGDLLHANFKSEKEAVMFSLMWS